MKCQLKVWQLIAHLDLVNLTQDKNFFFAKQLISLFLIRNNLASLIN
jgi:hypothetical protein